MKYIYIVIILFPVVFYGQNPRNADSSSIQMELFKQTIIPLNTEGGIHVDPAFPYAKADYIKKSSSIDGFEVDKEGNFLFISGANCTLSIFNKKKKKILSKNYNELNFSKIHLYEDEIYALDNQFIKGTNRTENSLYKINKSTGEINLIQKKLITNNTQQPVYLDSSFVLEVHDNKSPLQTAFLLYDLKGKYIKQVKNNLNIPDKEYKTIFGMKDKLKSTLGYSFLGVWENNRVYMHQDYTEIINRPTQFTLTDSLGNIINTYRIDSKILGPYFYGPENDFEIIRNGSIFILRRDRDVNNAIITELPLNEIFK